MLEDLYDQTDQAVRDSENLAMLVDRDDFGLTFDYVNAVSDPDDPQTKRERQERKRRGIKPPPLPVLRAVALRRPEMAEQVAEFYARIQSAAPTPAKASGPPKSKFDLIDGNLG